MFAYSEITKFYFEQALALTSGHLLKQTFEAGNSSDTIKAEAGSRQLGQWLCFYCRVLSTGKIAALEYQVEGNPALIALAEWLAEQLLGLSIHDIQTIQPVYLAAALQLPEQRWDAAQIASAVLKSLV